MGRRLLSPACCVFVSSGAYGEDRPRTRTGTVPMAFGHGGQIKMLYDIKNRTGELLDSQDEVGGWPGLESKPAPQDTDQDGMPDGRVTRHGAIDTMSQHRTLYCSVAQPAMAACCVLIMACTTGVRADTPSLDLKIEQVTSGVKHHFFGYIGQCQTIPWNLGGRYILGMEIERIDRMPQPEEAAIIVLVDTKQNNKIIRLDKTHAWNPQQGTMFYWNPQAPQKQFFFNDRDVKTGHVLAVLYDIETRKRVREYRYDDTPIGNGGVAPNGRAFLGLNYGRLARLRVVTGYPDALDWSRDDNAPDNDGIFVVDIRTGNKRLLVSYRELAERLKQRKPHLQDTALFINHTLWNRRSDRVYFFVRGAWDRRGTRINTPCSIHVDGTGLTLHDVHIGGHPEWAEGNLLIGRQGKNQILYDVDKKQVVGHLGTPEIFPNPEGDISLSPNAEWFVNGYKKGNKNYYVVYRRRDGAYGRSEGLDKGPHGGDIRIDPAPRWNRTSDAILVPGIAKNKTRQMFVIRVVAAGGSPPAHVID